jgi:hypothetical protein
MIRTFAIFFAGLIFGVIVIAGIGALSQYAPIAPFMYALDGDQSAAIAVTQMEFYGTPQPTYTAAPRTGTGEQPPETDQQQSQERVILRDASLSITVHDVPAKIDTISAMASEMGGWVVTSNTSTRGELIYGNINIRIPAERLDEGLSIIKTGVEKVNSETVNGRDVTQQYIDLNSRLTNLEAAESQLQTLMDRAANVEEVLDVHAELVRVRGEIESIRGQLQYFDEASAFSSVSVTLSPVPPNVVTTQAEGWNPGETVENALGALLRIVQFVIDSAIYVTITVLPPLLVIGLPLWWGFRRYRRSKVTARETT